MCAAFREQQLAKIANGTTANQLEQYRQQKLAEVVTAYPELLTAQDTDRMEGRKALQRLAEATVSELSERSGYTRDQIIAQYNSDPTMRSRAAQEAAIALGRERLAKQAMKEGRVRPKLPPVQRPGSYGEVRQSESRLQSLSRKFEQSRSAREPLENLLRDIDAHEAVAECLG